MQLAVPCIFFYVISSHFSDVPYNNNSQVYSGNTLEKLLGCSNHTTFSFREGSDGTSANTRLKTQKIQNEISSFTTSKETRHDIFPTGSQKSRVQRAYTPRDQNITLAKTWFLRILHPVTTQVHRKKAKNPVIFKLNKWLFSQRMEKTEIYVSFQKFLWKLQFLNELCNVVNAPHTYSQHYIPRSYVNKVPDHANRNSARVNLTSLLVGSRHFSDIKDIILSLTVTFLAVLGAL